MSRSHASLGGFPLGILLVAGTSPVHSQVIDFETLPGGGPTVDQQEISTEYATYGVTFSLLSRTTGEPIGSPRIAKAGAPQTAFEGCTAPDTPLPNLGLGVSFLTDGTSLGVEGDLRIEYSTPVAQASGVILDMDCRVDGGPPCEQWTVTAYDSSEAELQVVLLDAPQGGENPACVNPDAGQGDSQAFGWSFDVGTPEITSIILRYTGEAGNVGLAFDNFSVAALPGPPVATASAAADTLCPGESVLLTAAVTDGLPPYSYRWQRESGPSIWSDLGTDPTQEVQPPATSNYRVVVTDAAVQESTSPPVTVTVVAATDSLCAASLLVSSYDNSSIVRYGFRSRLPEVFVTSGDGGLSGASKLICGNGGDLYVSSQSNDRILRFDGITGDFVEVFVEAGSGGLNIPVGLEFGPDGNLYVASAGNHSILRYDGSDGTFLGVFVPTGSGLNSPTGLVFGSDDDLYVASNLSDKVLRFDGETGAPLGDFVTEGSGGLDAPRGLTFGPDGNLYVAEQYNDSVRRYDGSDGSFLGIFVASGSGGLDRANDVVFGPDGRLYVPSYNNDRVLAYDGITGDPLGALDDSFLVGPAWVAVGCAPRATDAPVVVPESLGLTVAPSAPNPFRPSTRIDFTLPEAGWTRVTVIDVTGRLVVTLADRRLDAGPHRVVWDGRASDGRPVPAGVYFARVESGHEQRCVKMVRMR
jgi:DNA-binding beta-propeller fold protein YncE